MITRVLLSSGLVVGLLLAVIAIVTVPGMIVAAAVFGLFAGTGTAMWAHGTAAGDAATGTTPEIGRADARRLGLLTGMVATAGWLVVTGLAQVLGAATGSVLLLIVVTAVTVVLWRGYPIRRAREGLLRIARQPLTARPEPGDTVAEAAATDQPQPQRLPGPSVPPAELSTTQLCRSWQHTYFALLDLPAGAPFDHIVTLRAELLDEIERRDPEGFALWLDTGARAGSNPGRFLAESR